MTQLVDAAFERKKLHGSNFEMTYGGALSFMRRNYTKDLTNVDVAISGIPFDLAVTNRSGARLGPRAIREASTQLAELLPYPHGFNPFEKLAVVDYGDCFLDPHNPLTIRDTIIKHTTNFFLLVLSFDSSTYANLIFSYSDLSFLKK
jgi:agmatinase